MFETLVSTLTFTVNTNSSNYSKNRTRTSGTKAKINKIMKLEFVIAFTSQLVIHVGAGCANAWNESCHGSTYFFVSFFYNSKRTTRW